MPPGRQAVGRRVPDGGGRYTGRMADPTLLDDRYRVVRKLGSGAFATVYLADDQVMGRPVAIKIVTPVRRR